MTLKEALKKAGMARSEFKVQLRANVKFRDVADLEMDGLFGNPRAFIRVLTDLIVLDQKRVEMGLPTLLD